MEWNAQLDDMLQGLAMQHAFSWSDVAQDMRLNVGWQLSADDCREHFSDLQGGGADAGFGGSGDDDSGSDIDEALMAAMLESDSDEGDQTADPYAAVATPAVQQAAPAPVRKPAQQQQQQHSVAVRSSGPVALTHPDENPFDYDADAELANAADTISASVERSLQQNRLGASSEGATATAATATTDTRNSKSDGSKEVEVTARESTTTTTGTTDGGDDMTVDAMFEQLARDQARRQESMNSVFGRVLAALGGEDPGSSHIPIPAPLPQMPQMSFGGSAGSEPDFVFYSGTRSTGDDGPPSEPREPSAETQQYLAERTAKRRAEHREMLAAVQQPMELGTMLSDARFDFLLEEEFSNEYQATNTDMADVLAVLDQEAARSARQPRAAVQAGTSTSKRGAVASAGVEESKAQPAVAGSDPSTGAGAGFGAGSGAGVASTSMAPQELQPGQSSQTAPSEAVDEHPETETAPAPHVAAPAPAPVAPVVLPEAAKQDFDRLNRSLMPADEDDEDDGREAGKHDDSSESDDDDWQRSRQRLKHRGEAMLEVARKHHLPVNKPEKVLQHDPEAMRRGSPRTGGRSRNSGRRSAPGAAAAASPVAGAGAGAGAAVEQPVQAKAAAAPVAATEPQAVATPAPATKPAAAKLPSAKSTDTASAPAPAAVEAPKAPEASAKPSKGKKGKKGKKKKMSAKERFAEQLRRAQEKQAHAVEEATKAVEDVHAKTAASHVPPAAGSPKATPPSVPSSIPEAQPASPTSAPAAGAGAGAGTGVQAAGESKGTDVFDKLELAATGGVEETKNNSFASHEDVPPSGPSPSPVDVEEAEEAEQEPEVPMSQQERIKLSILAAEGEGDLLFDESVSFSTPLKPLPDHIAEGDSDVVVLYAVLESAASVSQGVKYPMPLAPGSAAALIAWMLANDTADQRPFQVVGMRQTVARLPLDAAQLVDCTALPNDPAAQRVLLFAVQLTASAQHATAAVDKFLLETQLSVIEATDASHTNKTMSDALASLDSHSATAAGAALQLFSLSGTFHMYKPHSRVVRSSGQDDDDDDADAHPNASKPDADTATSTLVCVLDSTCTGSATVMKNVLERVDTEGLDLAGIRIVYGGSRGNIRQVVAAVRGPYAHVIWGEALGPLDPLLAKRTDPQSLRALHGHVLLSSSRTPAAAARDLVHWFGGRVEAASTVEGTASALSAPKLRGLYNIVPYNIEWAALVISGLVAPHHVPAVIHECVSLGFAVDGFKVSSCGRGVDPVPSSMLTGRPTFVILRGEHAGHRLANLLPRILSPIARHYPASQQLLWCAGSEVQCAAAVDAIEFEVFRVPSATTASKALAAHPKAYRYTPDLDRTVVAVVTPDALSQDAACLGVILARLLAKPPASYVDAAAQPKFDDVMQSYSCMLKQAEEHAGGFQLIGAKLLPWLPANVVSAIQPSYGSAPDGYKSSEWVHATSEFLRAGPALVLVLRRVHAAKMLTHIVGPNRALIARTEAANSLRGIFASDDIRMGVLSIVPGSRVHPVLANVFEADELQETPSFKASTSALLPAPTTGLAKWVATAPQTTVSIVVMQADGIARRGLPKLLKHFHTTELSVIGTRMWRPSAAEAQALAALHPHSSEEQRAAHEQHLQDGPVLAIAVQGHNAVGRLWRLLGPFDPEVARRDHPTSFRATFGKDEVACAVLNPTSLASAMSTIAALFPELKQLHSEAITDGSIEMELASGDARIWTNPRDGDAAQRRKLSRGTGPGSVSKAKRRHVIAGFQETTCLLLGPDVVASMLGQGDDDDDTQNYRGVGMAALQRSQASTGEEAVALLDSLLRDHFEVAACRLTCMDAAQARAYAKLREAGMIKRWGKAKRGDSGLRVDKLTRVLTGKPCLVLALHCANAIAHLCAPGFNGDEGNGIHGHCFASPSTGAAADELTFFFDSLACGPDSVLLGDAVPEPAQQSPAAVAASEYSDMLARVAALTSKPSTASSASGSGGSSSSSKSTNPYTAHASTFASSAAHHSRGVTAGAGAGAGSGVQ